MAISEETAKKQTYIDFGKGDRVRIRVGKLSGCFGIVTDSLPPMGEMYQPNGMVSVQAQKVEGEGVTEYLLPPSKLERVPKGKGGSSFITLHQNDF